jgi:hypothetical protein
MMRLLHILAAGLSLLLLGSAGTRTGSEMQGSSPVGPLLAEQEEFEYEVTWTIIPLGTIRLLARPDYSADAWIDSYDGIPYVSLHSRYHTQMDTLCYSRGSWSTDKQGDGLWAGLFYHYDIANRRVIVEETKHYEAEGPAYERGPSDTLTMDKMQFVDGLSIAYLPRTLVHGNRTIDIPTVLHGKLGMTTFLLPGEKTTIELDAVDAPVKAIEVGGSTSVVGIFGMSGNFTGWFSDDACAVPLRGTLKVLLGSVTIELVRWNRKGWAPPQ